MNNTENLPPVVTVDLLKNKFGAGAAQVYNRVARAGGFGDFQADYVGGSPALDIQSLPDETKKNIAEIFAAASETSAAPPPPFPEKTADENYDEEEN